MDLKKQRQFFLYPSQLQIYERGVVSVAVVMLMLFILVAAVAASLSMSSSSITDSSASEEQISALFMAESGLQRAVGLLTIAAKNGDNLKTVCEAGIGTSGPFFVGGGAGERSGSFTYNGSSCNNNLCTVCMVAVTGTVGSSSRNIRLAVNGSSTNGTAGFGNNVSLTPINDAFDQSAAAVLNLAWAVQSCDIDPNPPCTDKNSQVVALPCVGCVIQWEDQTSTGGTNAVGSLGSVINIPGRNAGVNLSQTINNATNSGTKSTPVYALVSRSYAEVGGLFPSNNLMSNTPSIIGKYGYWNSATTTTTSNSATVNGSVSDGVSKTNTVCVGPQAIDNQSNISLAGTQSCTNWCYGADTLIMGISGKSQKASGSGLFAAQSYGPIVFNPNQGFGMTQIAHIDRTATSTEINPQTDLVSEIWYAYNPNFSPKLPILAPALVQNETYQIASVGSTDFTTYGASANAVGIAFVANKNGLSSAGTGTATPLDPFAYNASSYKGKGTGAIGARWTGGSTTCGNTGNCVTQTTSTWSGGGNGVSGSTLTVNSTPSSPIYPGALIVKNGGGISSGTYITRQLSGVLWGVGVYELSSSQTDLSGGNWTATNSILTIGNFSGVVGYSYPTQIIVPKITSAYGVFPQVITSGVGDIVTSSGGSGNNISGVTIVSQLTSTELGGMATGTGGGGTYSLVSTAVNTVTADASRVWIANSNVLNVTDCLICFFDPTTADAVSGLISNKTLSSQLTPQLAGNANRKAETVGGVGRYVLNSNGAPTLPTTVASSNTLKAGTPSSTIYLPSTSSMPTIPATVTANTPRTVIQVYSSSATGTLAAGTTVTAVQIPALGAPNNLTNSFTVSTAPTSANLLTPLDGATICGGTCAMFTLPSGTTTFTVTGSYGAPWAAGFTCLYGVSKPDIHKITKFATGATNWHELVK